MNTCSTSPYYLGGESSRVRNNTVSMSSVFRCRIVVFKLSSSLKVSRQCEAVCLALNRTGQFALPSCHQPKNIPSG